MNSNIVRFGVAAAAVVLAVFLGIRFLGPNVGSGTEPTATPSPTPLAVGSFSSHGGRIQLDATGDGSNVTGSMTYTDVGGADVGHFTVDLVCTRTTDGGLILIGGPVTDSTNVDDSAPTGSNVAIVLQRGSPVRAVFWLEHPDPHEASCPAFLDSIPDVGDPEFEPIGLEPIEGTVELRP